MTTSRIRTLDRNSLDKHTLDRLNVDAYKNLDGVVGGGVTPIEPTALVQTGTLTALVQTGTLTALVQTGGA